MIIGNRMIYVPMQNRFGDRLWESWKIWYFISPFHSMDAKWDKNRGVTHLLILTQVISFPGISNSCKSGHSYWAFTILLRNLSFYDASLMITASWDN